MFCAPILNNNTAYLLNRRSLSTLYKISSVVRAVDGHINGLGCLLVDGASEVRLGWKGTPVDVDLPKDRAIGGFGWAKRYFKGDDARRVTRLVIHQACLRAFQ